MRPWSVGWTNFRGFSGKVDLQFPRITLLIGRNNVGKTSAYAPLLLLRQTLEARNPRTSLLTRGEFLDVGTFRDLITDHDVSRTLTFSVGLDRRSRIRVRSDRPIPSELEVSFESEKDGSIALKQSRILDTKGRAIVTRTRKDSETYQVSSPLLPTSSTIGRPYKEVTELRRAMREEKPEGFLFNGFGALLMPRSWSEDEERWEKVRGWYNGANELVRTYRTVNAQVELQLRHISYLGPLRSLPKRTYQLSAEVPTSVGRDGEFAPELLFRAADSARVREVVDDWLTKFGYGRLKFRNSGDDFFQVSLCSEGKGGLEVNLAHCGIGISQLLPMLVQGVLTPNAGTFIAQQPEIHLNPAQQCLVTDFLIDTASRNRRVIVETHSEHILLRLRRRIAEGGLRSGDVAVYFFDYRDGRSVVERVSLGERAELDRSEWPSGFFEEQLQDSFALAVAQSTPKAAK